MAEASKGGCVNRATAGCAITRPAAWRSGTVSAANGAVSARQRASASSTEIISFAS